MSPGKTKKKATKASGKGKGKRPKLEAAYQPSVLGRGDLTSSLLFVFPLFLIYEIGALFSTSVNGADFVTRAVFSAVGGNRFAYLSIHLGLALAFLLVVLALRRRRSLQVGDGLPMVLESAVYALTLGSLILVFMNHALGMGIESAETQLIAFELGETSQTIIAAMGAGVHEELVFRLGLFVGIAALLSWLGARRTLALLFAALASAALFSLAHHVGALGEPLVFRVFVYRLLAGLAFTAIFYYRSLAHAVYSHFLYDVYVMVLHP